MTNRVATTAAPALMAEASAAACANKILFMEASSPATAGPCHLQNESHSSRVTFISQVTVLGRCHGQERLPLGVLDRTHARDRRRQVDARHRPRSAVARQ